MSSLLPFVLTAMQFLAPGRDHFVLGTAIADEVEAVEPLFEKDSDRRRTAALVVSVAFRESSLRNNAVGDHGHSVCAVQVFDGPKSLLNDPHACIRKGLEMLRVSVRIDRLNPLSFYARGPRYATEEAKRISRDRVALARRVFDVAGPIVDGVFSWVQ